jgi:hypothetical protein
MTYDKCPVLFIVMLSVVMLNVVMLSVVMMSVVMLSVVILSVVVPVSQISDSTVNLIFWSVSADKKVFITKTLAIHPIIF